MNKLKNNALINQLDNIVDSTHIQEVKKVIDALMQIACFKHNLNESTTIHEIYNKIEDILKSKFNIERFQIIQVVNKIEIIQYGEDVGDSFEYIFSYEMGKNGIIKFLLNNSHLDDFDKIYLNNYLEEITNTLCIYLVIETLQQSAFVDPLTKLKNRLSFKQDMHEIIPLALRENMNIGVLIINIDRFRAVNDEHGTHFGDEFLKLYAKIIKDLIRNSDIAVRFGGGEFLILLMNVIDKDKVMDIANHIQEELNKVYLITSNNDEFKKTVSIGISLFPTASTDMDEVVKNAEIALSDAKDKGRNQILFYEEDDGEIDLF